jgi:hypothetical protein
MILMQPTDVEFAIIKYIGDNKSEDIVLYTRCLSDPNKELGIDNKLFYKYWDFINNLKDTGYTMDYHLSNDEQSMFESGNHLNPFESVEEATEWCISIGMKQNQNLLPINHYVDRYGRFV